jgi:hypothetical protein
MNIKIGHHVIINSRQDTHNSIQIINYSCIVQILILVFKYTISKIQIFFVFMDVECSTSIVENLEKNDILFFSLFTDKERLYELTKNYHHIFKI